MSAPFNLSCTAKQVDSAYLNLERAARKIGGAAKTKEKTKTAAVPLEDSLAASCRLCGNFGKRETLRLFSNHPSPSA